MCHSVIANKNKEVRTDNHIRIIYSHVFAGLEKLTVLDLSNNDFQLLSIDILTPLTQLRTIAPHDIGLCCFLPLPVRNDVHQCDEISCDELLAGIWFHSLAYGTSGFVCLTNVIAFMFEVSSMTRNLHPWSKAPLLGLTMSNSMLAVYWYIVLIYSNQFGIVFSFYRDIWLRSSSCKYAIFFSTMSQTSPPFSVFLAIIHWYMLVATLFSAMEKLEKFVFVFCGYVILPIGLALTTTFLIPNNSTFCFMVIPRAAGIYSVKLVGLNTFCCFQS